jgi:malate dehydrogenase (oxaloacetate-decarboxylating)(NADP+)
VKLVQQLGALTLERVNGLDGRLSARLTADDPALAAALEEYQQLKRQLLASWALTYHAVGKPGKLQVTSTKPSATAADLSVAYSPGVAEPCLAIRDDPEAAYTYTTKGHLVAVLSNGTAVLGLGSIGALASKPVMEGKAVLLKRFADVDAIDVEIDTRDPEEFVETVTRIAVTFGGINLEDIAAPDCFWIEQECKRRLDIPVMHDDQHGTAIVVGAGLLNALQVVGKRVEDVRVVFSGAGAAGFATARFLLLLGVRPDNLVLTDVDGVVYAGREHAPYLDELARETDLRTLPDALAHADVFVGVSAPRVLTPEMLQTMAPNPIVFALANPVPEIDPDLARAVRSDVLAATGRSDHSNQVNNVLAFPYLFRGALDTRATAINEEMKRAAAAAIADLAREPITEEAGFDRSGLEFGRDYLIPKPFDRRLLPHVAAAVADAAMHSGAARRSIELGEYRAQLGRLARL